MTDPNPHAPSTLNEAHAQGALSSTALAALEKLCADEPDRPRITTEAEATR